MKNLQKIKREARLKRHRRVRAKLTGTSDCPRLSVFRSHKHIYAQLVNDEGGWTLVSASDQELKSKVKSQKSRVQVKSKKLKASEAEVVRVGKIAIAYEVGQLMAEKALKKKIQKVIFDRGGYKYHGRVKAVAEGAREGGLQF